MNKQVLENSNEVKELNDHLTGIEKISQPDFYDKHKKEIEKEFATPPTKNPDEYIKGLSSRYIFNQLALYKFKDQIKDKRLLNLIAIYPIKIEDIKPEQIYIKVDFNREYNASSHIYKCLDNYNIEFNSNEKLLVYADYITNYIGYSKDKYSTFLYEASSNSNNTNEYHYFVIEL